MVESITSFLAGDGGIWALCLSAFLSSTVLPGSSEALLAAALACTQETQRAVLLVVAASLFNTLGSMTTWAIGRYVPHRVPASDAVERLRRWGAPGLVLAWVPVIGDVLPLAAGCCASAFGRHCSGRPSAKPHATR